jgi:hypothetical protein
LESSTSLKKGNSDPVFTTGFLPLTTGVTGIFFTKSFAEVLSLIQIELSLPKWVQAIIPKATVNKEALLMGSVLKDVIKDNIHFSFHRFGINFTNVFHKNLLLQKLKILKKAAK